MLMAVIKLARKRVVSVDAVPLPLPLIKTKAKGLPAYVAKSNKPRLVCDFEGCKFVTIHMSRLTRHNNSHLGIKPFTCCGCGHKFSERDSLNTHVNKGCVDRRTTMKRTPIKIISARRLAVRQVESGKEENKPEKVSENETVVTTSPRDDAKTAPEVMLKRRALIPIQTQPTKQTKLNFPVIKKA